MTGQPVCLTLEFGRMTSAQGRQVTYFADLGKCLLGVVCFTDVVSISRVDCGNSGGLKMLGDYCTIQSIIIIFLKLFISEYIGATGKEFACQCRRCKKLGFNPWEGKIPSLKKEMATHSSIIAWEIRRTGEPGRLQFMGHEELGTT